MKLFLAGYGLASFHALETHGLLEHVFPATARALASDARGSRFACCSSARSRAPMSACVADKPVTPAFLFAALLWGQVRALRERACIAKASTRTPRWAARQRTGSWRAGGSASRSRAVSPCAWKKSGSLQPRFDAAHQETRVPAHGASAFSRRLRFPAVARCRIAGDCANSAEWWTARAGDGSPGLLASALAQPAAAARARRWRIGAEPSASVAAARGGARASRNPKAASSERSVVLDA